MNEKQIKQIKEIGSFVLLIGGGALIGYLIGFLIKGNDPNPVEVTEKANKIFLIIGLIFNIFFVLFIHELGHIIGGLMGGNKFGFLIAGPLKIERKEDKLHFGWNTNMSFFGGLAMTYPQTTDNFRKRRTTTIAGGPLASLLLALLGYSIYVFAGDMMSIDWRTFMSNLSLISAAIFITTIIPMKSGGFMSDGMQLLQIYKGSNDGKSYEALLQLVALSQMGIRPRDIEQHWYDSVALPTSNESIALSSDLYHYYYHLDTQNLTKAAEYIAKVEEGIEGYPSGFRYMLQGEMAFFEAYYHKNMEKATQLWEESEQKLKKDDHIIRYRTAATIEYLKGNFDAAKNLIEQGLAKETKALDKGSAKMEIDILKEIKNKLMHT